MKDIIIVGAGGMGREVLALLKNCNNLNPTWNILGFVDDGKKAGEMVNAINVLGSIDYLNTIETKTACCTAISLPNVRKELREKITNPNIYFPTLKHPTAQFSDEEYISTGNGCLFMINTLLTTNITMGDFAIVNAGAIINHDAEIGSYTTIMPGVNISTGAKIGEGCYIGTGCKISKPVTIPNGETLLAGTIIA